MISQSSFSQNQQDMNGQVARYQALLCGRYLNICVAVTERQILFSGIRSLGYEGHMFRLSFQPSCT